jgi:predicted nucleic acid-binding protein
VTLALDTSVVVRLLIGTPAAQATAARLCLANAVTPVAVSDLVVSEAYFALRHHYAVPHLAAVRSIQAMLADPKIESAGIAAAVVAKLSATGEEKPRPGLMDLLIHAETTQLDRDLVTFDHDLAARLPRVRLLQIT